MATANETTDKNQNALSALKAKSKNQAGGSTSAQTKKEGTPSTDAPKKKRGRPAGSKNKEKTAPKVGRPKKPANELHSEQVPLYLTPPEYQKLKKKADADHRKPAEYLYIQLKKKGIL